MGKLVTLDLRDTMGVDFMKVKQLLSYIGILIVIGLGLFVYRLVPQVPPNFEVEVGVIDWISDGDTITVTIQGGPEKVAIRMLGVDSPESKHVVESRNTPFGIEAAEYTKNRLNKGQTVYLTKDSTEVDDYGRLLRYIWLKLPEDPFDDEEVRSHMYNAQLLLDGYALANYFPDDATYYDLFCELQEEAAEGQMGLWTDPEWIAYYSEYH